MEQSEELQALRDAVRGLLSGYPTRPAAESPAGYDAGLWARLCKEIGVAGLAVPEQYGGAGATLRETCVVLEELGRGLTPTPMLGSAVLAGQALLLSGDAAACARLLPGICAGERTVALAWTPPTGRSALGSDARTPDTAGSDANNGGRPPDADGPALTADADGRLTGVAQQVLDADLADTLLVVARKLPAGAREDDGPALYEVDADAPGVTRRATDSLDLTRRLGVVRLDGAPGRRLGGAYPLSALRDVACVALSAEQVGTASRALELTVEYAKIRFQFNRPIGSFQSLQHRLADAHVRLEAARSASHAAAEAVLAGAPDAPVRAAMAKVHCTETLQAVAAEMVQIHGGIAITWEHDAHLYLRRAYATAALFGTPGTHLNRLTAALLH